MLAFIGVNGATGPVSATATANADTYNSVISGQTLVVSDPAKGLIANDIGIYGVMVVGTAPAGLTLNPDGTFTYTGGMPTTFTYCGNGATSGAACALVTLGAAPVEAAGGITMNGTTYTANGTFLKIQPPGILAFDKDLAGYPLSVNAASVAPGPGLTLAVDPMGRETETSYTADGDVAAEDDLGTGSPSGGRTTVSYLD